jgi:hypothetical protein
MCLFHSPLFRQNRVFVENGPIERIYMLTKVRATAYPGFGGPMLVDALGVPRQSDHSLGLGGLDDALADLNVEALCSALEAYFLSLKKAQVEELSSDFSRFDQVIQVQTVAVVVALYGLNGGEKTPIFKYDPVGMTLKS